MYLALDIVCGVHMPSINVMPSDSGMKSSGCVGLELMHVHRKNCSQDSY